jgi:hypothetical protein
VFGFTSTDVAADEIWTVGAGGLCRFDGREWSPAHAAPAVGKSVWTNRRGEAWVAGGGGLLYRWRGALTTFRSGTRRDLHAIFGDDTRNVWAVGERGTILRATSPAQ